MKYTFSCLLCSYSRDLMDPYSMNKSPCYTDDGDIEVVQFPENLLRRKMDPREIRHDKWVVSKEIFIYVECKKHFLREFDKSRIRYPSKDIYFCPKCHRHSATFDPVFSR